MGPDLPDKLFFSIGETSEKTGIKPYILRYWESEFKLLHPEKDAAGQRIYKKKDIETIFRLKKMLYEEGYTIAGAKKKLKKAQKREGEKEVKSQKIRTKKQQIKRELKGLLDILKK